MYNSRRSHPVDNDGGPIGKKFDFRTVLIPGRLCETTLYYYVQDLLLLNFTVTRFCARLFLFGRVINDSLIIIASKPADVLIRFRSLGAY